MGNSSKCSVFFRWFLSKISCIWMIFPSILDDVISNVRCFLDDSYPKYRAFGWFSEFKNWPKSHGITESPDHRPQQLQSLHNVAVDQVALFGDGWGFVHQTRLDFCGFKRSKMFCQHRSEFSEFKFKHVQSTKIYVTKNCFLNEHSEWKP